MPAIETIRPDLPRRTVSMEAACSIGESGVLKLLGSMYLCKPSAAAIREWAYFLSGQSANYLDSLKLAFHLIDADSREMEEALLWDYTRLFIGPYKLPCPPWESVYRSHAKLMMQDAADDVKRYYAASGLSVDGTGVMPDHIGVELNFLSLIYERAVRQDEGRAEYLRIGEAFLNDHLLQWAPQFSADVEAAASALLYRSLAAATRTTLALLSA